MRRCWLLCFLLVVGCADLIGLDNFSAASGDAGADAPDGATHDCIGASDGTPCAGTERSICLAERCVVSRCGDWFVDRGRGEFCDDGRNGDADDGCTDECETSCTQHSDCDNGNRCDGVETCSSSHRCKRGQTIDCDDQNPCTSEGCEPISGNCIRMDLKDGPQVGCSEGKICLSAPGVDSTCLASVCGDGFVDKYRDEKCDDRKNGDNQDGCRDDCTFTCESNADCNDHNGCTDDVCTDAHRCSWSTTSCEDQDPCTDDTCATATGCVNSLIDEDQDGYSPFDCRADGVYAGKGGDCADSGINAELVHPGASAYYPTDHALPNVVPFDYDCSGHAEKKGAPSIGSPCLSGSEGWAVVPQVCGEWGEWQVCGQANTTPKQLSCR